MLLLLQRFSVPNVVQHLVGRIGLQVEVNVRFGNVTIDIGSKDRLAARTTILMKKR